MARQRRRHWEDDEKRRICLQTLVPGVSVSQVARRYDVNANLIFKWLRDPRFAPAEEAQGVFLPVEVGLEAAGFPALPPAARVALDDRPCCRDAHRIEITTPDGCTVNVSGDYDPEALARLIRSLSA